MRLKELDIQGFKSFPDRTKITIGPGITAVVGPNGSGKSIPEFHAIRCEGLDLPDADPEALVAEAAL